MTAGGRGKWQAAGYAVILLWVNAYICRDLFSGATAYTNSMHGFWMALAQRAAGGWFHAVWWPYWDLGTPFEYAYSPLVPGLAAAWSALRGIPVGVAFHSVSGLFYCLCPLTLFVMAWRLTRAPGYSFMAALIYSLVSVTQIVVPDGEFGLTRVWQARRLFMITAWDDTPHLAALAFLPLTILFLARSIETRRKGHRAACAVSIALAGLASAFGPVTVAMAAACLLFVLRRHAWQRNLVLTLGVGAYGWAMAAPFLSPSLLLAMREAAARGDATGRWSVGSLAALALVAAGWIPLWYFLRRRTQDWTLQFFVLFAWLTSSIPVMAAVGGLHFLPQPDRYKFEMELALSLAMVFGSRWWFEKMPPLAKKALVLAILAVAAKQIAGYRWFEKLITRPHDIRQTVEYKAALWASRNLAGERVYLPGSVAQWANAFGGVQQYAGGSFSLATNPVQQLGNTAIRLGAETPQEDARLSLLWLKAYGVSAVGMSAPASKEYWHPFRHPAKFDGLLPALWSEDGVTLYRVPVREIALAHVVPEDAVVPRAPQSPMDMAGIAKYVAALDDRSLPLTAFRQEGPNRMRITAAASGGQVVSVQVSDHAGWHATTGGRALEIHRDGLGLMWVRPECPGPCEIQFDYDGGWELRICRWLSYAAIAGIAAFGLMSLRRRAAAPTV